MIILAFNLFVIFALSIRRSTVLNDRKLVAKRREAAMIKIEKLIMRGIIHSISIVMPSVVQALCES